MEPKIVIIVPYRNRVNQYNFFIKYMTDYMEKFYKRNEFKIFFCHQQDNRPFNRGAMKNSGFLICKKLYKNYKNISFVFQDIDTLPKIDLDFETKKGIIKDFYGVKYALHGLFSITGYDFERINGYPNFWYWGLEDNVLYDKAKKFKIKIDTSVYINLYDLNKVIIQDYDKDKGRLFSHKQGWEYKNKNYDNINNLKIIKFNINGNFINIENFKLNTNYLDYDKELIEPNLKLYLKDEYNDEVNINFNNFNYFNFKINI